MAEVADMRQNRRQSVCLRNAFKHYGSMKNPNHVLSNLNMTVAIGTIYGLLGASGCGKTTLLSCIVGRRRLNTGEIWVLGGKPGTKESGVPGARVGYMPQELALCPEFTIKETMMYFGCIFGMTTPEISDRLQFLIKLLVLPTQKCMVKNLSAGQQRRVSLAVALMHEPELLILDEPTVGVDPLLRQSIWDHLVRITRPGDKTVIITTHYIEEARQAHTIGMMRSGRLLAEEAPQALLTKYGRLLLEDVFLELSRTQGDENQVVELNDDGALRLEQLPAREEHVEELEDIQGVEPLIAHINGVSKGSFTSSGKLKALIKKNFWCMHRNIGLVVFCIGLPIIQSILFCIAIGPDPTGLQLAIVNMDTEIVDGYCPYNNTCSMKNLSCRYLAHLNNGSYIMEYFANLDDALDSVRKGDSWGAIYFNENYTDSLVNRLFLGGIAEVASVGVGHMSKAETFDLSVMKEFINSSEVKVWLDMSNQQIGLKINKDVLVSYRDFQKDLMIKCGSDPKLGDIPIDFQYPIYGNFNPSFTNFVAPGVILTIVFFLAVAQTSAALILERTEGLLDRSLVAGVTNMEIFFCHVVTQFLVMILQTALVLFIMIVVFKVECKGNHGYVIMLTVLQGLCGMGYGFAISAACVKERTSIEITLGSYYPTLLLSGIIWPIEGMPMALRYISKFLPLTLATTSLRAILSRGWSITEFDVYIGFIGTVVWIIIFLVIIITIIKCKRE